MDKPAVRDGALLIFRALLGVMFVAHGWQKLVIVGMEQTTGQFLAWGVPQPKLSAWVTALGELLGGAMLVVGLLTTLVAGILALLVTAAIYFVHLSAPFFPAGTLTSVGELELPLLLLAGLGMIVVFGSGRASVDGVLARA